MPDIKLTVEYERRAGKDRVKFVRLYVSAGRAMTEGDVTAILTEREADELMSSYVRQLRNVVPTD